MSKTVRVHDPVTNETRTIPAAELAPGMIEVTIESVGQVWIDASRIRSRNEYLHPPFNPEVMDFIEAHIRKPLAEVYPKSLAEWEGTFRRDTEPEQEIALWCQIAECFTEFNSKERLNPAQQRECLAVLLHCTTSSPEAILQAVTLQALTRDQAQRAIAAYLGSD